MQWTSCIDSFNIIVNKYTVKYLFCDIDSYCMDGQWLIIVHYGENSLQNEIRLKRFLKNIIRLK